MRAEKVIMLAAGVGSRLGEDPSKPPKALLQFGGRSLLERHLDILRGAGIREVVLGVGYQAERIAREAAAAAGPMQIKFVTNSDYRSGSIVTLACLAPELEANGPVLLMDADVLYDDRMIERLQGSSQENCFLLDRSSEDGEEPVKICVRGRRIVEFRKKASVACDYWGESVGFFRFGPGVCRALADLARSYVAAGRVRGPYEDAIRELVLERPEHAFGFEDVTGLPWIEIDFPEDVERARSTILPRLTGAGSTRS